MRLTKIKTAGFRSLQEIEVDFDALTVLIGENDAGKSSVLDLLDIFLGNLRPEETDYHLDKFQNRCDKIEITLEFLVKNIDDELTKFVTDNKLIVKKLFSRTGDSETFYWGAKPQDDRLSINISSLPAPEQKDFITELDPSVESDQISNAAKRLEWFKNHIENSPKIEDWIEAPGQLIGVLPRFERYSSMDYHEPGSIIFKTLRQVYEQSIYDYPDRDNPSTRKLIEPLLQVEATAKLKIQEKVKELQAYIHKYNNQVTEIDYEPSFDFNSSLKPGEFLLNRGFGLHALSRIGDGTKRRMFIAVTDWDREVTVEQAKSGSNLPFIIRGYDEPDTSLHYDAQRLMYSSISEIVSAENSRTQAILCTHSLTMIDRAPAHLIRLFRLDNGCTRIEKLILDDDPEIEAFLKNLAREMGITNSIMFYERCFILVEGDTEESALPIFYRKLYDRSLLEDCTRIINVKRNSAVREFLKVFEKNRQDQLIIFIDSDSEDSKDANLTRKSLTQVGFGEDFVNERFIFVGDGEFEDAFPDKLIVRTLQRNWPKIDGAEWVTEEIKGLRKEQKFSKALKDLVWKCTPRDGMNWTKPIFGRALAENCDPDEIPQEIISLFKLAQQISGSSC